MRGRGLPLSAQPDTLLTDVVSFIEDHNGLAGQLFGHQVCDLGVQEVVVAVNYHVGVQDLGTQRERLPPALLPPVTPNLAQVHEGATDTAIRGKMDRNTQARHKKLEVIGRRQTIQITDTNASRQMANRRVVGTVAHAYTLTAGNLRQGYFKFEASLGYK